ncbi:hypothetical protein ABZ023_34950 [Streptomyces sp. NPDC006367]
MPEPATESSQEAVVDIGDIGRVPFTRDVPPDRVRGGRPGGVL